MSSPIEETFWTAKEWSERTRVPYRTILAAAARGDLAAVRPSGSPHGIVLISEASWSAWLASSRMGRRSSALGLRRLPSSRPRPGSRSLSDLALS